MELLLRGRLASLLALVAFSAIGPLAALHFWGQNEVYFSSWTHFLFIAIGSLIAGSAAVVLTVAGARRGDGRTVLLGIAFSTMTSILLIHGLATPGVLVGDNGLVAFSGGAVLPVGGAVLALSALPSLRRPRSVRPLLALQGALLAVILTVGAVGMAVPDSLPAVPETGSTLAVTLLVLGFLFFAVLAQRAVRTYTLTRRRADLLVVVGVTWLGVALFPQFLLSYVEFGWWIGHGLELLGVCLVGAPVALDLYRGSQSRPLAGDLRGAELVASEEAFLGAHVRALMAHLATKDAYTEDHTRRVALRAVEVGEDLGLSGGRLRALAIGGLLHDMGKLTTPNEILQKPGPLDEREYTVIRRHPRAGRDLLEELGGFPESVLRLVLDHHERLDRSGYPRALDDREIDLETRILAVCDVYDALISKRVYRRAWSQERALGLLRDEAGTAFDPKCVAALERVLAVDRLPASRPAAPALAWAR